MKRFTLFVALLFAATFAFSQTAVDFTATDFNGVEHNLFDILDGGLARITGKNDAFGGFFDSIVDRYADLLLLTGLTVYYAKVGRIEYVVLSCIVTIGTVLIPYTRAKAERFLPKCNVGLIERPERIILLAMGGIFNMMPLSLGILGVLTHVTVFQRIHYSWKEMSKGLQ